MTFLSQKQLEKKKCVEVIEVALVQQGGYQQFNLLRVMNANVGEGVSGGEQAHLVGWVRQI